MDLDQVSWTETILLGNNCCQAPKRYPEHSIQPNLDAPHPHLTFSSSPVKALGAASKLWRAHWPPSS